MKIQTRYLTIMMVLMMLLVYWVGCEETTNIVEPDEDFCQSMIRVENVDIENTYPCKQYVSMDSTSACGEIDLTELVIDSYSDRIILDGENPVMIEFDSSVYTHNFRWITYFKDNTRYVGEFGLNFPKCYNDSTTSDSLNLSLKEKPGGNCDDWVASWDAIGSTYDLYLDGSLANIHGTITETGSKRIEYGFECIRAIMLVEIRAANGVSDSGYTDRDCPGD